ncbi:MAG: type II toxin-antitoxin system HicB family antitoxin [Acidobacteriota bacterium]|nr:type II toxin-antitoxin system HicB family antitoxin [Acidobacteriota bacterium]MDE3044588.1 type II toxin-antitoxin system HicB family antitoxin [Acidobacteriota bacterium]
MSVTTPNHYSYRVSWSNEDDEYVASCLEFPSLSWLAATELDALRGLIILVSEVISDLKQSGEPVPTPLSDRKYSGRFVVRTSPQLHARLVREAAEQGSSLNQWLLTRLAQPYGGVAEIS